MSDTISRHVAIDAINHICPVDTEYDCTLLDRVDVRCVLSDLPSAQPEIIRCRECYYRLGRYCHYRYTTGLFISADHYCGFAKRQEDNK